MARSIAENGHTQTNLANESSLAELTLSKAARYQSKSNLCQTREEKGITREEGRLENAEDWEMKRRYLADLRPAGRELAIAYGGPSK